MVRLRGKHSSAAIPNTNLDWLGLVRTIITISNLTSILSIDPDRDQFRQAQRKTDRSDRLQWSLGYGWWILPGAMLGLVFWIVIIRWIVGFLFPN